MEASLHTIGFPKDGMSTTDYEHLDPSWVMGESEFKRLMKFVKKEYSEMDLAHAHTYKDMYDYDPEFDENDMFNKWVHHEIQDRKYKHGDIVWTPPWLTLSRPEYGLNIIVTVNNENVLVPSAEGMAPITLCSFENKVNFGDIYKKINTLLGYDVEFKNDWYYWSIS